MLLGHSLYPPDSFLIMFPNSSPNLQRRPILCCDFYSRDHESQKAQTIEKRVAGNIYLYELETNSLLLFERILEEKSNSNRTQS